MNMLKRIHCILCTFMNSATYQMQHQFPIHSVDWTFQSSKPRTAQTLNKISTWLRPSSLKPDKVKAGTWRRSILTFADWCVVDDWRLITIYWCYCWWLMVCWWDWYRLLLVCWWLIIYDDDWWLGSKRKNMPKKSKKDVDSIITSDEGTKLRNVEQRTTQKWGATKKKTQYVQYFSELPV